MKHAFLFVAHMAFILVAFAANSNASTISYLQLISDQFQQTIDVYTDADAAGNHFLARGEFDATGQDLVPAMDEISPNAPCFAGITCITATFDPSRVGWGGWYWLNGVLGPSASAPSANWGTVPNAGYDLTGATVLRFWARGLVGGEVIHFFAFGVGNTAPPYQPYADSSPKQEVPGGAVALTTKWTMYQIPLTGDLHYVLGGFAWEAVTSEQKNPGPVVFYLDNIQYIKARPADPRLLVSYQTIKSTNSFDTVMRNPGFIYDNSVALISLLASGDLVRATTIADAIVYAQNHDRFFTDGRIRNAGKGGDISLAPGWTPNGLIGTVSMPGWYDSTRSQWYEDETQVSTNTGNVAWAGLAMMNVWQTTKNPKYLQAAQSFGNWVLANASEVRGGQAGALQGFTAGVEGWESNAASGSSNGLPCATEMFSNGQCKRLYKSTEHNIDLAALFSLLYLADGSPKWATAAACARHFVFAMWDQAGKFWTGTDEFGATISTDVIPLDVQVWSLLMLGSESQPYLGSLPYIEANHKTSLGYGFKQNSSSNNCGNKTWFEGTSQVAVAYKLIAQNTAKWQSILSLSQSSQDPSGGMPATDGACLNTGFTLNDGTPWLYYPRLHVGATSWRALAELGVNPYRSDLYSPAFSTQTLDFGNQNIGVQPVAKTYTFSNPSPVPLSIASIAVTGVNSSEFSEKNTCKSTLPAGTSCTITVMFSPVSAGPKAASVVVDELSDPAMLSAQLSVALTGLASQVPATFALSVNVSPSIGGAVSASPASTNGNYAAGTLVCLTPVPAPGWTLVSWSGAQLDSNGCLTMNSNESVTASFSGNLRIVVDSISLFGSDPGTITGHLIGSGLSSNRIAPFLFHTGLGWYTKPLCSTTTVPVDPVSGAFSVQFTSGGVDRYATQLALLAVPAGLSVGCYTGVAGLPDAVTQNAVASIIVRRPNPEERTISFASQDWGVKATTAPVGPGSCVFSDSASNAFVDGSGHLHLVAANSGGWTCAEVFTRAAVGYGVYKWTIDSAPSLDPAAVFGSFTWEDAIATPHEIDVEFGFPQADNTTNAQEAVQPYNQPGNLTRITLPTGVPLTFVITWLPSGLKFQVFLGVDDSGNKFQEWQYQGTPPAADGLYQNFRFNVWFNGTPASGAANQEVVIDSFSYEPFTVDPTLPVVSSVVSSADYSPAAAPGAAASAFGTGLATGSPSIAPVPLPQTLGSVSATVNGIPAPLFYTDTGQIDFQIPGVTPAGPAVIGPVVSGRSGHLFPFNIFPAAPSMFRSAIGTGCLAQNQDFTRNSAANPAQPGSVIVAYLTGIGAVDNPVSDGYPAPLSPLSRPLAPTTATLGGLPADVQFVGLAPSLVAVAQANIVVPAGAAAGQQALTVTVGSYQSVACNIVVAGTSGAPRVTTTSVPAATVGQAYSTTLTAVGGTLPYKTWSVTSGLLPPGLSLDAAAGMISGTPTSAAGSPFGFSVQVMDSKGVQSAAQTLSLVVNTTFTISGHATLQGSGTPVAGVVVTLSGAQTATATTGADGSYQFTGLHYADSYGLSAAKTGFGVNPIGIGGVISGNVTADFTVFYLSLSGRIVDQNNAGISGVLVTVTGSHPATTTTGSDGSFSIYGFLSTDTYTAVPSKTGYTFSPAQYSNTIGTNANISFVGTNTTFTISGHATLQGSGTPVAGVVVTLSGAQTATATTGADGSYQFTGLHYADSYGLSAAKTGFGVNPIGIGGVISGNVTADFTVFYLSLSGRIVDQNNAGISGVLVTVTGSHPATTTTGSDGSFSIYGFLSTDTYTAVPSKTGYTFSPAQYSNTIGTNANISFVGTNTTFTISGHATLQGSGTPVAGVVVTLSGAQTATATTGADGSYQFTGLHYADSYGLSAAKTGFGVNPIGIGGVISGNVTADFTVFYLSLSGRIVDQNNAGISGVLVTVTGSHPATTTTGSDGSFSIYGFLSTDTYTAVPSKTGYTFSPAQYSNTIGTNANISFVGTNTTFTISGHATLQGSGTPVAGVVVTLSGAQTATATTGADGSYQFTGLHYADSYGLSAAKTGFGVNPIGIGGVISGNVTADFTVFYLSLSGRIVDQNNAGISGVLVTVTGSHPATTTTGSDGSFSIYGFLSTDTYTAVPSKTGYTFSPAQYSNTIGTNANISFVGTNTTFTISGHATLQGSGTPVAGVVVTLSGAQTATATTGADGSYQFTGLHYADSYGLSAAKTGFGVNPIGIGGVISGNVTADFTVFSLIAVSTSSLPGATVGVAYSQTLTATGGTPPYKNWNIISGSLPPGLGFDTSLGAISGTPTSAVGSPYVFSVTVGDSNGAVSAAQSLSIAVQTLTISQPAITASVQGGTVSGTVTGVSPAQAFKVAVYALTNQFYIQPCIVTPLTSISASGAWSTLSHNGEIFALLVTSDYTPPNTAGSLPAVDGRYVLASVGPVGTVVNSDVAACPAQ